VKKSEKIQKN